jgi:hypothetical protein
MMYDRDKVKQPFAAPPIPDEICTWIGKLAITWSFIELQIDELIAALAKVSVTPPPSNLERLNFKKRKELCRDLAKEVFSEDPQVLGTLQSILGDAADLHWRRNFILHGRLQSTLRAPEILANGAPIGITIDARSRHNGRNTTLTFQDDGLERLFYDIGHVAGRLRNFVNAESGPAHLPSLEKQHLQDFLSANLPNPPTMQMP